MISHLTDLKNIIKYLINNIIWRMIDNLRTSSLKSKKLNYTSAAASLLPLLTCKKT
jgi:hypothetical protein